MVNIGGVELGDASGWFSKTGSTIGAVLIIFLVVATVGGIAFYIYLKKVNKKKYIATVNLFKVVNGKKFWIGSDKAEEVVIPGTNVRLLHWKKKGLWSAYPTRSIGFNVYAYMLNRMGELTNFDMGEGEDETEARVDYDHRDQTYAYLNLQEFITRNYKDRNVKSWWKENIGLISTIVMIILLGLGMWFFFSQSAKQLASWSDVASSFRESAKIIAEAVTQSKGIGSGVVVG